LLSSPTGEFEAKRDMNKSSSIIGATGRNSVAWTQAFLDAEFRVRNLVRDPGKFTPRPNLDYMAFDLDDRRTYDPGLAGIGVLALVTPVDPRQTERELALIEAAEQNGVERILSLSVIGADLPEPISAFARWQAPVEEALKGGVIPHVTLRPNAFMQNLLLQKASIQAGQYVEPSESEASSLIDVRDIAAVAVEVADGGADNQALDLTGSEAFTGSEIAQVLSAAIGKPVAFISPPIAAFRAALLDRGAPLWRADALAELYQNIQDKRAPHLARITPHVERMTGRTPRTLREFVLESFVA
jgi:uncharacterized protein YbjT (DUF2867 family)